MLIGRRAFVVAAPIAGVIAAACTGDDEVFRPAESYTYDASTFDRAAPPVVAAEAAAPGLFCGDAAGAPQRVLVVNGDPPGELAALNLDTHAVDGRFFLDGGLGVTSTGNLDPWLLDQTNDTVIRLDPREPWKSVATWDVHGADGTGSSKPVVVAQVSCTKAYVLRANRDRIAVIDPSQSGGVPTSWVVAAPFEDITSAVWVPAKKKVFVLAANLDRATTSCADRKPAVFAIDIATDAIVSLAGKGPAGSIELSGYAPPLGSSLLYDAPLDRLLVLSGGCTTPPSAPQRRQIEQIDLATGAVKTILDLTDRPAPTGFALVDGDHAMVVFGHEGQTWNPRGDAGLAAFVDGGVDIVANDGRGGFIGARRRNEPDGGGLDLVTLPLDTDGGTTPFASDPFSARGGSAASLEPWPHR